eukprot:scaffold204561_cov27-Prasinocladus_malaysianus.AAC.1
MMFSWLLLGRTYHRDLGAACHIALELHHDVSREVYVFEHAFQLVCELAAALRLELADHALLRVDACGLAKKQPLGEILL